MAEGEFVWGGWRNPYQYILGETHADIGRLSRKIADVVNNLADELYGLSGKEWRELPKMQAYSGRGMMGKYCLGVSVGSSCLSATLKELEEKGIPKPVQDALGMGAILYWQNIPHDKAIHRNTLTKQGTHESVEIDEADASSAKTTAALSSFLRKWRRNEDDNAHAENVLMLARFVGSPEEVAEAKGINREHDRIGHLPSHLNSRRYALYLALKQKFQAKYPNATLGESVDHGVDALAEAKRQPEEIYFPSYTAALNAARAKAEREGYEIDEDDWNTRVTHGYPSRPSEGETTNVRIGLSRVGKGGKPEAAMLVIAVYGMKQSFELTSYISKVRMGKHEVQVRRGHGRSVGFRESVEEAYGNPFTPRVAGGWADPSRAKEKLSAGTRVKVPHKGKMVSGKIVRYDDGGTGQSRQHGGGYVVDVGEYASILVPDHKIWKEEVASDATAGVIDEADARTASAMAKFDELRSRYSRLKRVDPDSPEFRKLQDYLDNLDRETLTLLWKLEIPWISPMARNRLRGTGKN